MGYFVGIALHFWLEEEVAPRFRSEVSELWSVLSSFIRSRSWTRFVVSKRTFDP